MRLPDLGAFVRNAFFALLPAAAISGAMALPLILGLAGAGAVRPRHIMQAFENKDKALWLLLAFAAWVVISALWSANHDSAAWLKLLVLVPLGLAFIAATSAPSARMQTFAGVQASLIVIIALLALEVFADMPLNRAAQPVENAFAASRNISRATTVLVGIVWGGIGGLILLGGTARRVFAGLALAATGVLVTAQAAETANLAAFFIGAAGFAAAFAAPRVALLTVTTGLSAWLLAAPFLTPLLLNSPRLLEALPYSWAARIGIWDYVCTQIAERPLIGHGLDAARMVEDRIFIQGIESRAVPVHPHSASLQIWLETGAIGAILAAAALFAGGLALSRALRDQRAAAAAAAGTIAALGFIANISFSLWQEWWLATLFIAAAITAAIARPRQD